jgi:hypothetical protein
MPSLTYDQRTDVSPAFTPADARGASFTPAVGQAVEQLGGEGARLSADMQRIHYMQQEANGVVQLEKNLSEGYRNFSQSMEQWKEDPNVVQQDGSGLTQKFVSTYDDWSNKLVEQQTLPRLKRMAAERVTSMGDHFFNQASQYEIGTNRAWRIGSFHDSINTNAATIQQNPDLYDSLSKTTQESLDAMRGLHPSDYYQLKDKATNTYAEAAFLGTVQKAPQYVANLLTGQHPLASGSIPQKIVDYANSKGVNPATALAVAQFESRMNPGAVNGKSVGLYQVQPDTGAMYGVTDLANPDENIKAGIGYLADNQKAFRSTLKRDPTLPELYAMHLLGTGGGMALAKADDSMPFADLAGKLYGKDAQAVQNANHLQNLTVGQVKAQLSGWMAKASNETAGMANAPPPGEQADTTGLPSYMQHVTPQFRASMLSHAQSLLRHDETGERATIGQQINDFTAAALNAQVGNRPPTDAVIRAFGPGEGPIKIRDMDQAQAYGAAKGQLFTQTPEQQAATLAQERANLDPMKPGYAHALNYYNLLQNAAGEITNQRLDNIVSADRSSMRLTKPLDMSNPQLLTGQLAARFEQVSQLADQWHVPDSKVKYLAPEEAGALTEFLQQAKPSQAANYLASFRSASGGHPERYSAALQQIGEKDPLMATAGAVATADQDAAASIIRGRATMKDEKLLGVMADPRQFDQWWNLNRSAAFGGAGTQSSRMTLDAVKAMYADTIAPELRNSKVLDMPTLQRAADRIAPVGQFNGPTIMPIGMTQDAFVRELAARYDGAMQRAGKDPKEWRFNLMHMAPLPHADGLYEVYSGTMSTGAVIDLNQPADVNVGAILPPEPQVTATVTAQKKHRMVGR